MENTKWYVIIDNRKVKEFKTWAEAFAEYVEVKRHPNWNNVRTIVEMKNTTEINKGKGIACWRNGFEWKFDNTTGWTKKTGYTMC